MHPERLAVLFLTINNEAFLPDILQASFYQTIKGITQPCTCILGWQGFR